MTGLLLWELGSGLDGGKAFWGKISMAGTWEYKGEQRAGRGFLIGLCARPKFEEL